MFKAAGLRKVIWYCCALPLAPPQLKFARCPRQARELTHTSNYNRIASSRGRGTRAAGWFADYIADRECTDMQSLVLFEGIKGWAKAGEEFVEWMDEYNKETWVGK